MKSLVFDAGPIITLSLNNLLWILEPLKTKFNGEFCISPEVRNELVDKPLKTRKYKFEALQVLKYICKGVLKEVDEKEVREKAQQIIEVANSTFRAKGHDVKIVHSGEVGAVALALHMNSNAIVVDERTTRYLIEKPDQLQELMASKLHTKVSVNKHNLDKLKQMFKDLKVIRSVELVTIAYEMGLLEFYVTEKEKCQVPDLNKTLLESVLWGAKLNGCAISEKEINSIIKFELNEENL